MNSWVIDSGSSIHITGFREVLDSMKEENDEEVTIGDDSTHPVKGVGTCTIKLNSSVSLQVRGVLYVPGIKRNLVSISTLEDNGYRVTFMDNKVLAWPKNSSIKKAKTTGQRQGYLYELCTKPNLALIHETIDANEIWHRRLGHLSFRALSSMGDLVTSLPKLKQYHSGACTGCALGKNTKGALQSSTRKTSKILELVHSDVCGPMFVPSLGGFLYYVIFVDDYSRKTWIYFLKCKESEEILNRFKEFKSLTENY